MIWTQALGASHCRRVTSAPTSKTAANERTMIQCRRRIRPRGSGLDRGVARQRVELGCRAEVLPVTGAELRERVGVLLRSPMFDGVDRRQRGQSANHRPGPPLLHPQDEAGAEG